MHSPKTSTLTFTDNPSNLSLNLFSSSVPAGFPSPADDHIEGKLDLNEHLVRRPSATFFVRAAGESMRDAGIFDGDLLVIDRSISPKSDDIVIASIHGELTVKRIQQSGKEWVLVPANPDFPVISLEGSEGEVWGVVTHSIRRHCGR
ncbi:DNA polymerase V [Novosphingobium sp. AAP83]|uniref:LexA family protein n=1 Tax=Novosphingobium sp. AAP83 TaxID=1523425 RepID=UPI0006B92C8B|nr:translesion error-prone DNA polymerase V autoproteolytic subunit [Novosphingobium sp. AAP83]KPF92254.1 DNA polymerase V [Novosphingobium sp. AAP83]